MDMSDQSKYNVVRFLLFPLTVMNFFTVLNNMTNISIAKMPLTKSIVWTLLLPPIQ